MLDLQKVEALMEHQVTRKEFLHYITIAMLGVFGVTNILRNLNQPLHLPGQPKQQLRGYGASAYGE